jgi:hypothetical protein
VPARPGEYDGTPRAGDDDADGVADDVDVCPRVFDPPRPLDEGRQADADADGIGDVCDACPLDPRADCEAPPSDDLDADGIGDAADGCPRRADASQEDTDEDGVGDACDACEAPNPGVTPCPLTIAALRDPTSRARPPRHALVLVADASVAGVRPDAGNARGFSISDGVAPFSGIFVFTGSAPAGVVEGERVTLAARLDSYQESDELVAPEILESAPGDAVEPLLVATTEVGDGGEHSSAYESMLVRIEEALVTNANPDAPSDYDELLLDDVLRIDDLLDPSLDNAFAVGTRFRSVTGVLGRTFGHWKIWPRSPSDLELAGTDGEP